MEVSLYSNLPHATPPERLEPSENNSLFIVDSEPVVDCAKVLRKETKLNTSIPLENLKSKPLQGDNLPQCSIKNYCDNIKNFETKMRVEAEEVALDTAPVAEEVISPVNGDVSKETIPCIPTTPDTCSISNISVASASKFIVSSMESAIEDSNTSSIDSPQKKKRYLFNFRPSLCKILVKTKSGDSFKCYTCGGIYRQKFSLKRHFLRTHIDYRYISEADIANCKIPVPSYIAQHSNSENTANGRKKFKKSSDDVFLENNDSGLLPGLYRCHDCTNVSFDTDAELREHYNKHPDSIKKKYECTLCQASFIKKQILSRHLAGHEGKKIKLICKKCNIVFISKDELDKHLSTHSSGKTCRICEKELSNVANRRRHERLHLNSGKRCPHCDQLFTQRKELDRHIQSQHSQLSRNCNLCDHSCPSAESLALHMKEKHSTSPKVPEKTDVPEQPPKPKATRICFVCKRVFPTVYAMLKHRRNAHPFHSRRKRHRKTGKAKNVINKEAGINEYKKTYIRPGPGRPKGSGKKIAVGEYMEKRDRIFIRRKELNKKEEAEFYHKVHENIAYNLTNCIEGKASQLSLKEYNFRDIQQLPDDFEERVNFPWQFYNFPTWYDVSNVLKVKGREIKRPENLSIADEFLQNAAGLTPANLSTKHSKQGASSMNGISFNDFVFSNELQPDNKRINFGKEITSVLVCHVCKEGLDSHAAFTEHCINNHPNVVCSYVEIFGNKDSPPIIPPEMCKNIVSPVGFRFAYDVPPVFHKAPVTCTKCRKIFRTVSELHEHIVICGNLLNLKPKPRFKVPISSKHNMRKRMTMAQFRSGFNNRSGQTPEKRLSFLSKTAKSICDKKSRSEKLLFYKNGGRLQPKSFTIDKNYFTTKPKPVKSGMSKRGRKSYEEKSLAYRYAGMQPSTSRECPHCRIVFASTQLLNAHSKSCSQQLIKKNITVPVPNSSVKNVSENDCVILNTPEKKTGSESGTKSVAAFSFHSSSSSAISSEDFSFRSHETSQNKSNPKKLSSNMELSNVPIDLSISSSDKSSNAKISNQPCKSALEVAMEAVQKHLTEVPNDEPILKLQQITDKFAGKISVKSPLVSPVLKSGSVKKVGRPRKLKRETSTPIPVQKELIYNSPDKKSSPKPKKLEEIVKGIKESKVRTDERCLQKKEPQKQTLVPKTNSVMISLSVSKIGHSNLLKSHQKTNNNDVSQNLSSDKNIQKDISQNLNSSALHHNKSINPTDLNSKCSANVSIYKVSSKSNELPVAKLSDNNHVHDNSCKDKILKLSTEATSSAEDENQKVHKDVILSKPKVEASSSVDSKIQTACKEIIHNKPNSVINSQVSSLGGVGLQKESPKSTVTEIILITSNSGMNVPEKSNIVTQDANVHGRSSPSSEFECLLKSINQRLLSEDKNQQDDSAIPWLEDEKFEIPPSRPSPNLIVTSNTEKVPFKTENSAVPQFTNIPGEKSYEEHNLSANELLLRNLPKDLQVKTILVNEDKSKATNTNNNVPKQMEQKLIKEKTKVEDLSKSISDGILTVKGKTEHINKTMLADKKSPSCLSDKTLNDFKTSKNEMKPSHKKSLSEAGKLSITQSNLKNIPQTGKFSPVSSDPLNTPQTEKSFSIPSNPKIISKVEKSTVMPCDPKNTSKIVKSAVMPSDPKNITKTGKSSIMPSDQKNVSKTSKSTDNTSEKRRPGRPRKKPLEPFVESSVVAKTVSYGKNTYVIDSLSLRNNIIPETNVSLKRKDTSSRNSSADDSICNIRGNSSMSSSESALLTSGPSSLQCSGTNVESDKPVNQTSKESQTIESSNNLSSKSKATFDDENDSLKLTVKSTTTEFGKSLASKMKEKMRLSLEQDLAKVISSTEDASNSNCGSENSETTDDKVVKVKKECENTETQSHPCPFCFLEFAYLTNYRRHIKQCKARDQGKELEPAPGTQSNMQYLPKKDEVEFSMLNLYRFQSRQADMLKEDVNKHINTYECNICHKIYLNLFSLMQHKLSSHKLVEQNNTGCSNEINEKNILSLADHLAAGSSSTGNDSNTVDENIRLSALNNILENYKTSDKADSSSQAIDLDKSQCSDMKNLSKNLDSENLSNNLEDKPRETIANEVLNSKDESIKTAKVSSIADDNCSNVDSKNSIKHIAAVKENEELDGLSNTLSNVNSNDDLPPIKKKRGRPVGWRKNPDAIQETLTKTKKIRVDSLKKSLLLFKKKGEMHKSNTKLKTAATTRKIIDNLKNVIAKKKSKVVSDDTKTVLESNVVKTIKNEKTDMHAPISKSLKPEESIKSISKRPNEKDKVEFKMVSDSTKELSETTSIKNSFKLSDKLPTKAEANLDVKENNIKRSSSLDAKDNTLKQNPNQDLKGNVKRGRGRAPWKNVGHIRSSVSKSEILPKRRPGRPPKNSLSSSNLSQSAKFGIASSSSAKNPKRAPMPMPPLNVDSSDSDSNDAKNDLPVKKKVNLKCCALCSDKFVSSLELKRHIQLKHNRKKPDDTKSDLQRKILKGRDSRSSSTDPSESENDHSPERCDSPLRKSSQGTPVRKSEIGKSNPRSGQVRKTDQNTKSTTSSLSKSPSSDTVASDKDLSPKNSDTPPKKSETPKNQKICAICKQKFLTGPLLHQHLQMFHNRKSDPIVAIPDQSSTPGRKSQPASAKSSPSSSSPSPIRKKKELNSDRKTLSRQCRKPLPPLKRQRIIKKETTEQIPKKSKL